MGHRRRRLRLKWMLIKAICWLDGCYSDPRERRYWNRDIGGHADTCCSRCGAAPSPLSFTKWQPGLRWIRRAMPSDDLNEAESRWLAAFRNHHDGA